MEVEEVLKEAKKKISDPDIIVDVYDLTYVWVSDKLCKIYGYSKEEVIGKQLLDFEDYGKTTPQEIEQKVLNSPSKISLKVIIKAKDGHKVILNGEIIGFKIGDQPVMVGKMISTEKM